MGHLFHSSCSNKEDFVFVDFLPNPFEREIKSTRDMKDQGYVSIFKGQIVEADQVHEYLEAQGIGSLVRNHMQENLSAEWMTDAEHAAEVFVAKEDLAKAEELVKNMFHDDGTASSEQATKE